MMKTSLRAGWASGRRHLQVLGHFWRAAIATELEYRINFLIASLSSLLGLGGSLFGLFLFYRSGHTFQGWSWPESLVVLGTFTILQGYASSFLSPNLSKIVEQVQQGTLDFVLLKPINSQFWLSTRTLSPWGLPDILFGLALIFYAGRQLALPLSRYFLSLLPLACGLVILYSLWFILGATSIWFVKVYNATEVLRGLIEAGRFPLAAYPAAYRVFFTFVVPVAFLTTVPAGALLGRGSPWSWLGALGLALLLFWASRQFWRFALRFYTSASS